MLEDMIIPSLKTHLTQSLKTFFNNHNICKYFCTIFGAFVCIMFEGFVMYEDMSPHDFKHIYTMFEDLAIHCCRHA